MPPAGKKKCSVVDTYKLKALLPLLPLVSPLSAWPIAAFTTDDAAAGGGFVVARYRSHSGTKKEDANLHVLIIGRDRPTPVTTQLYYTDCIAKQFKLSASGDIVQVSRGRRF